METAISISFQSPRRPRTAQAEKETPESHPPLPFPLSSFSPFPFWVKVRDRRLRVVGKAGL